MARKLASVDAVLIGFGWTGAILGQELTEAGLTFSPLNEVAGVTRRRILRRPLFRMSCAIAIIGIYSKNPFKRH